MDKHNLEPTSVDSLYPTQENTCNRFALLATDEDDDDNEKTTILNNQTHKTMETSYSSLIMKINNKDSIADAGATEKCSFQEHR